MPRSILKRIMLVQRQVRRAFFVQIIKAALLLARSVVSLNCRQLCAILNVRFLQFMTIVKFEAALFIPARITARVPH